MPLPKPTRWTNPNLPQMLQIAVFLLYFTAASAVLARVARFGSATPYYLLGLKLTGYRASYEGFSSGLAVLLEIAAIGGFTYAAALVASEKKLGWQIGLPLAAGAVLIPLVILKADLFRTDYLINWLFDVALLGLLAHQQSREHVRIWFD
jgi:hypothetical protein